MIAVLQRCTKAKVTINNKITGQIKLGMVILIGIQKKDLLEQADTLVDKILTFRIFNDTNQKMNLSIKDINGSILVISQFTLCADTNKGRRPNFLEAAKPENAKSLYQYFINRLIENNIHVESGNFGEEMQVELINNGPATFILES
tara:strand:+ start:192 stop:629 length:438 start_codon:yes stop_codon:yes gene_type:complete